MPLSHDWVRCESIAPSRRAYRDLPCVSSGRAMFSQKVLSKVPPTFLIYINAPPCTSSSLYLLFNTYHAPWPLKNVTSLPSLIWARAQQSWTHRQPHQSQSHHRLFHAANVLLSFPTGFQSLSSRTVKEYMTSKNLQVGLLQG